MVGRNDYGIGNRMVRSSYQTFLRARLDQRKKPRNDRSRSPGNHLNPLRIFLPKGYEVNHYLEGFESSIVVKYENEGEKGTQREDQGAKGVKVEADD